MDELLAEAEHDVARTRTAKTQPADAPVVDQRRNTFWGSTLAVVVLLVAAVGLALTAATMSRFTGADYNKANRRGTATVKQCERHGPITRHGFGYINECTVDITWTDGAGPRVLLDKPGFMKSEKPGDTFRIGQNQGSRGRVSYSRPEVPDRGWVTWAAVFVGFLAFLCASTVYLFVRQTLKDRRHRRS
jgi:uncharacterized protein DUF6346